MTLPPESTPAVAEENADEIPFPEESFPGVPDDRGVRLHDDTSRGDSVETGDAALDSRADTRSTTASAGAQTASRNHARVRVESDPVEIEEQHQLAVELEPPPRVDLSDVPEEVKSKVKRARPTSDISDERFF